MVFLLALLIALAPGQACADPILTPIIIGGLGSIGISVAPAVGSFISGLVLTGGLLAYSLLNRPEIPKPDDGTLTKKQAVPPRDYAMGRCRISGRLLFAEVTGGGVGITIQALHDGWTDAIENVVLHSDVVTIGEDHYVEPVDSIRYGDFVRVEYRLGRDSQTAYPWVIENFPEIYDEDHRCDGITTLMVSAASPSAKTFQRTFPNGFPEGSAIGRYDRAWDPRDPEQSASDRTTWKFTGNCAVLALHYICRHPHGYRRNWQDVTRSTWDLWIAAMDVCDERVPLADGGDVARYECGGGWDAPTERRAVLQEILKSCDGWCAEVGDGSWAFYAGKYVAPSGGFVLDESNILALRLRRGVPIEDRAKAVVVTFISPDHVWGEAECDPWGPDEDDGRAVENTQLQANWVHHFTQARRLGRREYLRQSARVRGTVTTDLSGLEALRERYVPMNWTLFPSTTNIVVEIRRATLSLLTGCLMLEFIKADPNVDDWDPETDEGQRPLVPPPASPGVNPVPPPPTLVMVDRKAKLSVPVVGEFPNAELKAEYRKDGAGDDAWEPLRVPDPDELEAWTDRLELAETYEFRAAYLLGGYPGFWSPSAFLTTPA